MNIIEMLESVAWIALGFVPTLVFLEMSWRMGKLIDRRRMTGIMQQQKKVRKKEMTSGRYLAKT
jgi:hypothetical protein